MKFSVPNIGDLETSYVMKALHDGNLTTGVLCEKFEQQFKDMYGYEHVVSVNSGTSALHLALLAAGIGHGDEVIVSPFSHVASVNCVVATGATPVFADIERDSYNMDAASVNKVYTEEVFGIVPVDIFGVPCDIDAIRGAVPTDVFVLEDSIEALGSTHQGLAVGRRADAGAFGFFPNKQITTCEGGILYSHDKQLIDNVRRLSRHGTIEGDAVYKMYGLNQRLSDLHAAMGIAQLERMEEIQQAKLSVKYLLDMYFSEYRKQTLLPGDSSTEFNYTIELPEGVDKEKFIYDMHAYGVPIKPYFNDLSELPHLRRYKRMALPVVEEVAARTVALPYHHELTSFEIQYIHSAFEKVVR